MPPTPPAPEPRDPKADACVYLLHMLLQRQERLQPGFIAELIGGVQTDQQGVAANVPDLDYINSIFAQTLQILQRADAGVQAASTAQSTDRRDC